VLSHKPMHRPLNIAHRGARSLAPENTLSAARKALEIGADMWELDVGMTADGELVVLHDDTLERTSDATSIYPHRHPWQLHEFTLEELMRLDFGSWFVDEDPFGRIAAGEVSRRELHGYRGERIPTLGEALAFTFREKWSVNVEIKDLTGTEGDLKVVEATVRLIEKTGMTDRVVISSFNPSYLPRVSAANSTIATALLTESPPADPVSVLKRLRVGGYHPSLEELHLIDLDEIQGQGFPVRVWTVNDEGTMQSLIDAGVSGIFTDFPQRLKPLLERPRNICKEKHESVTGV